MNTSQKIKIAHVVGGLEFGGVEAMLKNYLSHMDLSQFEIHIISYCQPIRGCAQLFKALGCQIHQAPEMNREIYASLIFLKQLFRQEKFDIVHVHMTFTCFHALFAAKLAGVPVRVAHAHLFNIVEGDRLKQWIRNHLYRHLTCALGTHYLACSEEAADDLFRGVGPTKIIRNGLNLKQFYFDQEQRKNVRAELQLEDMLALVHVGRFTHQKNHDFLIEIFAAVIKREPRARLVLIGSGELQSPIIEKVRALNLQEQVIFLGNREDIGKLLNGMDQFILPSLYEGGPIVAVEAQTNGLPILAFGDALGERVKLTPLLECLDFNTTPDYWAERIMARSHLKRASKREACIEKQYAIENLAQELERYYIKIAEN